MKTTQIFILLFLVSVHSVSSAQKNNQSSTLYSRIDNYLESGTAQGFSGAITVVNGSDIVINKVFPLNSILSRW